MRVRRSLLGRWQEGLRRLRPGPATDRSAEPRPQTLPTFALRCLLLTAAVAGGLAAPAIAVPELHVGRGVARPGDAVDLPIAFVADGATTALQVQVAFDPALLSPLDVAPGAAVTDHQVAWAAATPGQLTLLVYSPTLASLGGGTVAAVRFAVAADAPLVETPVAAPLLVLSDGAAQQVLATAVTPGSVLISDSVVPIPTLGGVGLLALSLLLAAAAVWRLRGRQSRRAACLVLGAWVYLLAAPVAAQAPGDANSDGFIDHGDLAPTAGLILGRGAPPGDPDCTQDGVVDVRDMVCIIGFGLGPPLAVTVSPAALTVRPGELRPFQATVVGTTLTDVTWTATAGDLSPDGGFLVFYGPPAVPGAYSITATSVANPAISDTAEVTVVIDPFIRFVSEDFVVLGEALGAVFATPLRDRALLEVEVIGSDGQPLPGAVVDWSSADPTLVAVAATGPLTAEVSLADPPAGEDDLRVGSVEVTASYQSAQAAATVSVSEIDPQTFFLPASDVLDLQVLDDAPTTCERLTTVGDPQLIVPDPDVPAEDLAAIEVGKFVKWLDEATGTWKQGRITAIHPDGSIEYDELEPPAPAVILTLAFNEVTAERIAEGDVIDISEVFGYPVRVLGKEIGVGTVEVTAALACLYEAIDSLSIDVVGEGEELELGLEESAATGGGAASGGPGSGAGGLLAAKTHEPGSFLCTASNGAELSLISPPDLLLAVGPFVEGTVDIDLVCVKRERDPIFRKKHCVWKMPELKKFKIAGGYAAFARFRTPGVDVEANGPFSGKCALSVPGTNITLARTSLGSTLDLVLALEPSLEIPVEGDLVGSRSLRGPRGSASAEVKGGVQYRRGDGWDVIADTSALAVIELFQSFDDGELRSAVLLRADLVVTVKPKGGIGGSVTGLFIPNLSLANLTAGPFLDSALPAPGDPSLAAYRGPRRTAGLEFQGELDLELRGAIKPVLEFLGVPTSGVVPPQPLFSGQTVTAGLRRPGLNACVDVGNGQPVLPAPNGDCVCLIFNPFNPSRCLLGSTPVRSIRAGRTLDFGLAVNPDDSFGGAMVDFYFSRNGGPLTRFLEDQPFSRPGQLYQWTFGEAGQYQIFARLKIGRVQQPFAQRSALSIRVDP